MHNDIDNERQAWKNICSLISVLAVFIEYGSVSVRQFFIAQFILISPYVVDYFYSLHMRNRANRILFKIAKWSVRILSFITIIGVLFNNVIITFEGKSFISGRIGLFGFNYMFTWFFLLIELFMMIMTDIYLIYTLGNE